MKRGNTRRKLYERLAEIEDRRIELMISRADLFRWRPKEWRKTHNDFSARYVTLTEEQRAIKTILGEPN